MAQRDENTYKIMRLQGINGVKLREYAQNRKI